MLRVFHRGMVIESRDEKKYFRISLTCENFNSLLPASEHAPEIIVERAITVPLTITRRPFLFRLSEIR